MEPVLRILAVRIPNPTEKSVWSATRKGDKRVTSGCPITPENFRALLAGPSKPLIVRWINHTNQDRISKQSRRLFHH